MNLFELISSITGGQDPNKAILAAANPGIDIPGAQQQNALPPDQTSSTAVGMPAANIPQPNAPQGIQTPVTNPQTPADAPKITQSPPDLANMYLELMKKNQNAAALDSGLTTIAAGFSKYPENRAALLQAAGKDSSSGLKGMSVADFAALQKMQQDRQNQLLKGAALKGLMKQYNLTPDQAAYLHGSGQLDDVIKHYSTENLTVVESPDGTKAFYNPRSGTKVADVPGEPKK